MIMPYRFVWLCVVVCSLLFACGESTLRKQWQTNIAPADKPSVNFVAERGQTGDVNIVKVVIRYEDPNKGSIEDREMEFVVVGRGENKVFFELTEVPGEVIEISFPESLGDTFEARLSSGESTVEEVIVFREIK